MVSQEAFWQWRPRYHPIASEGWMNDPCGPVYNHQTGFYHLGFQWNPKGCAWGNMSWGSMSSKDLLHWDVSEVPSMVIRGEGQDSEGVYSGCTLAMSPAGISDGTMTAFYTSCNHLPLHFTLPYVRGSERVHMATSTDNGRSWKKFKNNPLLPGPPEGMSVYGWRDPFVSSWPALDRVHEKRQETTYGIISGGIRESTPTVFLYELVTSDLTQWKYLGHLVDMSSARLSRWTGDFGINWEVANFFPLNDTSGKEFQFLIVGAEGVKPSGHRKALREGRAGSSQLWLSGQLTDSEGHPELSFECGGILDHGSFYAGNSFFDPVTHKQVMFGWIMEGDTPESHYHQQGWAGMLSLPRVLQVTTIKNVCSTLSTPVEQLANFRKEDAGPGRYTVQTLAALPDARVQKLRRPKLSLSPQRLADTPVRLQIPVCAVAQWELDISFALSADTVEVGFDIIHSELTGQKTSVFFRPHAETIIVDRDLSTSNSEINSAREEAPHTLFYIEDDEAAEPRLEALDIRAFFDTSVLELFVNDRTVITTRVYPDYDGGRSGLAFIRPFSVQDSNSSPAVQMQRCDLWPLSLDQQQSPRSARK